MMARIPDGLMKEPLAGLELVRRGKVRDTYALPDASKLLVVASDRISIFDFVLDAQVAQKGAVLTAMNHYWRTEVMGDEFSHDLVAAGGEIDEFLPEALRDNPALQARAAVVRKLRMLPVEAIVRGCLTGSGLAAYRQSGQVCGHTLPEGLQDGDQLKEALFTPTTKAEVGHDEHISAASVHEKYGDIVEKISLRLFEKARAFARHHGIVLADTKFEVGFDSEGQLTVGDEVLTPDSSRFWDRRQWEAAQAKQKRESPTSYDKQFVRQWGKTRGIDKKKPESDYDVGYVHGQSVPPEVLVQTTRLYRYIFWRLTAMKLEDYQREMGINVAPSKPHVVVITGSDSDLPQLMAGLKNLADLQTAGQITSQRHIASCHRHPEELAQIARELPDRAVVIAGAGMAAQLPGVLKAHLVKMGKAHIPVIGIACETKGNEAANAAARLSMEQLPGQPVVLDHNGKAFFGEDGFIEACHAAVFNEFPPTNFGSKPSQLNAPLVPTVG